MKQENDAGKIVTFYSFKGGVGRTMAVANIAFLAALNGKRVLVMDWDLEAPGLAYYFRGMLDAAATSALKDAPGILDILAQWNLQVSNADSEIAINALQQYFEQGLPFENCVRPLVEMEMSKSFFSQGGSLDIIGPGAQKISALNNISYEEALAQFSWPNFFDERAGGYALESLRSWAKKNYDFVLIDSRTGLADISGICTMQLPDVVALCFAPNQQNIDGIAKVAAAIRSKRDSAVTLRAAPMRGDVNENSGEVSEAQALAISALTRVGGFARDALKSDLNLLAIPQYGGLPFLETLAAFVPTNPAFDPLVSRYFQFGTYLLGVPLSLPPLDQDVLIRIKHRLLPRNATVAYLNSLKLAEPERAINELETLIESAYDTVVNGAALDVEYLAAMIEVGLDLGGKSDSEERIFNEMVHILDILRILNTRDTNQWRIVLIYAIEEIWEYASIYSLIEDPRSLLNELDELLAAVTSTENYFKRITCLESVVRVSIDMNDATAFEITIKKIHSLTLNLHEIFDDLSSYEKYQLLVAEAQNRKDQGDFQSRWGSAEAARVEYEAGLNLLMQSESDDVDQTVSRMRFWLHYSLANSTAVFPQDAARHAIDATLWSGNFLRHYLLNLAEIVLASQESSDLILDFCEALLSANKRNPRMLISEYFGRQTATALDFLKICIRLINSLPGNGGDRATTILKSMILFLAQFFDALLRRYAGERNNEKLREKFESSFIEVTNIVEDMGSTIDEFPSLVKARNAFAMPFSSDSSPSVSE